MDHTDYFITAEYTILFLSYLFQSSALEHAFESLLCPIPYFLPSDFALAVKNDVARYTVQF